MFSVILPLYNKENQILATINTVLTQTYPDFELIVINDGSTDRSIEVVDSIKDDRIRIVNKRNGGVSSARNRGIKEAGRTWLVFIDGDDSWEPDFLELIDEMIRKYPNVGVFGTAFAARSNGEITHKYTGQAEGIIDNFFKESVERFLIHSSAVCVRKDVFDKVGAFNEEITHGEDLDMWARMAKCYQIAVSSKIKVYYNKDIEESASKKVPVPSKTMYYYIKPENITGNDERNYYQWLILAGIHGYLRRHKFKWALVLINKHWGFLTLSHYIKFYKEKLVGKRWPGKYK